LQDVREHAGLLLERGAGTYGFIHLTFQEYLAAVAIAQKGQQNVDRVVEELAAHIADDNWHEVALLTIGHMGISQQLDAVAGEVVTRLIKRSPGQPGQAVVLAGEAVVDSLPGGVDVKTCRYVQQVLTKTLTADRRVTPVLRAAAGRTLARLGDTRAGVALRPDGLPDIEWCGVPSGPFLMGNDEKTDPEADSDEQPQHTVNLPGYLISRYPVTNAQFTAFVQAGGYQKAAYWEEALGQGFWQPGQVQDVRYYLDDKSDLQKEVRGWRNQPVYFGEPFNLVNHPVVGISWYEGLAYCRWLEEQLAGSNRLKLLQEQLLGLNSRPVQGVRVRLPSEAEWEKAGRGSDGQKYPWGNEPDPNLANYEDTKIGVTSAVGCFAGGASPYGVEEMSGNVWEWTRSLWRPDSNRPIFPYPYDAADGREDLGAGTNVHRVVRGGAFDDGERSVRCACRFRFDPDLRDLSLGFRVVVSPLF
jgi:formylglycine-generating enzyme required for sulfatase activity